MMLHPLESAHAARMRAERHADQAPTHRPDAPLTWGRVALGTFVCVCAMLVVFWS